jgi:hypothetical protein
LTDDAGVGVGIWNTDLHPSLSCEYFWTMQAVMRSTLGMNSPQSRIASPEHICSCSAVWANALVVSMPNASTEATSHFVERMKAIFKSPF